MRAGKLLTGVALAAVLVGFRFYNQGQTELEVRERLVEVCGDDVLCVEAVEAHYEGCFEESYSLGSRRRAAAMDAAALVACLNTRSGVPHFDIEE